MPRHFRIRSLRQWAALPLALLLVIAVGACSDDDDKVLVKKNTKARGGASGVGGSELLERGGNGQDAGASGATAGSSAGLTGAGGNVAGRASTSGGGVAGSAKIRVGPPFPGAVGWAAQTPAGKGGKIVRVTTLSPTGVGSLAAALSTAGPRIVVFEVGGVIDLNRTQLSIVQPYVTVAGQTAPSPGITLIRGGIIIRTHDVVIQHLRVRPGEAGAAKMSGWEMDSISTYSGAYNVIVDHCSTSWGTDENLSASGPRFQGATPDLWRAATSHEITFSHNIVAEGLSSSTHSEGEHSKGGLIHDNVTNIAVVGNLYFSSMDRHPMFKGGARGVVVNNYIANPGLYSIRYVLNADEWTTNAYQTGRMAIVGNVLAHGPSTPPAVPFLRVSGVGPVEIFMQDNRVETLIGEAPPTAVDASSLATTLAEPGDWPVGLVALPASELTEYVRNNVGARPWERDAIDTRVVEQALSHRGDIIDSETEVGGYPVHEPTSAPFNPEEWDLETMTRKVP